MNPAPESESIWTRISPHLDEAMGQLREADRDALVLRFFEDHSFADVAESIGISEPAAKMRVCRALEKLRSSLLRRGHSLSGNTLVAALSAHAVSASGAEFAANVTSLAVSGGAGASSNALDLLDCTSRTLVAAKTKTTLTTGLALCIFTIAPVLLGQPLLKPPQPL